MTRDVRAGVMRVVGYLAKGQRKAFFGLADGQIGDFSVLERETGVGLRFARFHEMRNTYAPRERFWR